jgi:hypothetical protein
MCENATQRGNSGTALAGSVAAALRIVVKAILTGNLGRILPRLSERSEQTVVGQLTAEDSEGLGRRLLVAFFHEHKIPNMGDWTVQQQLANLKASGGSLRPPIRPRAPWHPPPARPWARLAVRAPVDAA